MRINRLVAIIVLIGFYAFMVGLLIADWGEVSTSPHEPWGFNILIPLTLLWWMPAALGCIAGRDKE